MTSPDYGLRNTLKDKLERDETVYSMSVRLVRGGEIASIAHTAGFDSIYVDLEHNGFSLHTTGQICIACSNLGVTPLVRLAGNDPHTVGRVLDLGALGVIVPDVHSAADIEAIVRAAKYSPLGERSLAGTLPQLHYRSLPAAEANRRINEATMVVAMIESPEGVEAVDQIAAVDGVDIILIGTNDLCSSLAVPGDYDHPDIADAYRKVLDACRKHNKVLGVGGLASRPDLIKKYVTLGARYVSAGTDLAFLVKAAIKKKKEIS